MSKLSRLFVQSIFLCQSHLVSLFWRTNFLFQSYLVSSFWRTNFLFQSYLVSLLRTNFLFQSYLVSLLRTNFLCHSPFISLCRSSSTFSMLKLSRLFVQSIFTCQSHLMFVQKNTCSLSKLYLASLCRGTFFCQSHLVDEFAFSGAIYFCGADWGHRAPTSAPK